MASPTTSSEQSGWSGWLQTCLGTLASGLLLLLAFMTAVDPYDSGHFGLLGIQGMVDRNTTTASASRARDQRFDSVIIGNSTSHVLDPAVLSKATGLRFVHLRVDGASPDEKMTVLEFFLRHHDHVGALVIVADAGWCAHWPMAAPFPTWLYGTSRLTYAAHLLSWPAVEHAFQRLAIGLGWRQPLDPSGRFTATDVLPEGVFREANPPRDPPPVQNAAEREVFPAITRLHQLVRRLPDATPVVLVVPPTFATKVPQPGTAAAGEREACNAALARVVAGRPRSNMLNYRVDNAMTRDPANFEDFIHYRAPLAAKIHDGIIESLRSGEAARVRF